MTAPRVLISGAGIAGLTTAFWLGRAGWDVTVIERSAAFRDGGQNVDVRGAAREVLQRMGLEDEVRRLGTTEEGTAVLDDQGRAIARFPVDDPDGPTAELEILRGDLARVILHALPEHVPVFYGSQISDVRVHRSHVEVALQSGSAHQYDLVVIAEGVRSRIRDRFFGSVVSKREIGLNMAFGTITRTPDDDRWWRWYWSPGGRQITLRPDNRGTTRATLAYTSRTINLAELTRDDAHAELRSAFGGAGWQTQRVVDGFAASADVYLDCLTQIRMLTWSYGRVCVTGDAAWCVTPLGGVGTSLAMIGGYVLAAYLSQAEPDGYPDALNRYEQWLRPLIEDTQKLPPGAPALFYPDSRAGVKALQLMARVGSIRPLRKFTSRVAHVPRSNLALPDMRQEAA